MTHILKTLTPLTILALLLMGGCTNRVRAEVGLLPPLEIARGLPSHAHCEECHRLARDWYNRVITHEHNLQWNGGEYFRARDAWYVWDYARIATDEKWDPLVRRNALQNLIDKIGWRAVLTAELPPPYLVP